MIKIKPRRNQMSEQYYVLGIGWIRKPQPPRGEK